MADGSERDQHDLASLLSIYPICEAVVTRLFSGDLIRLARLSTALRTVLHNFSDDDLGNQFQHIIHPGQPVKTSWQHLLSLTTHHCSALTHKDIKSDAAAKNPIHPCKHCSMPTCETCIIRTSLAKGSSEILAPIRTRTRYLCPSCWSQGKLRRDFRYPAPGSTIREHVWEGRGYGMRGGWCSCTVKKDQWVCGDCRDYQGLTFFSNEVPTKFGVDRAVKGKPKYSGTDETGVKAVRCYGSGCSNMISEPDRDRRRICLWCSRPLARQFGGEERMKWDAKIRAINAVSRSADIEEWARNRFRILTMSRRQMRGTATCMDFDPEAQDHDLPMFVRHLDAVNYRAFILDHTPGAVPHSEKVWKSKNGTWQYERRFQKLIGQAVVTHCAIKGEEPWGRIDPAYLRQATGAGASSSTSTDTTDTPLPHRRTNAELRREVRAARRVYESANVDMNDVDDMVQRRVHLSHLIATDLEAYSDAREEETTPDDHHPPLPPDIETSILRGTFLADQSSHESLYTKLEGQGRILDEPRVRTIPSASRATQPETAITTSSPTASSDNASETASSTESEEDIEQTNSASGTANRTEEIGPDDPPPYTP